MKYLSENINIIFVFISKKCYNIFYRKKMMVLKKMTAQQFLKNPTGKGSATVARRDRIKKDMRDRFDSLYKKSKKNFKVRVTKYKDNYYFIFKIPSEFYYSEGLYYDVVIEFIPPQESSKRLSSLDTYHIRFYSNSPNFMFTYAYIYNKDGLLIPWLKSKVSNKALKEPPAVRNPREEYGFEKSVYFALLYMQTNPRSMRKSDVVHTSMGLREIARSVATSNDKLTQYGRIKKKYDDKEKKRKNRIDRRVIRNIKDKSSRNKRTIGKPQSMKSNKTKSAKKARTARKAKSSTRR